MTVRDLLAVQGGFLFKLLRSVKDWHSKLVVGVLLMRKSLIDSCLFCLGVGRAFKLAMVVSWLRVGLGLFLI